MGRVKRLGQYHRRLLQLFAMHDKPLSHHEVHEMTKEWKNELTSSQLSNVLSKDEAFEFYDIIRSGGSMSTKDPTGWDVNRYVLSPIGEELASLYPTAVRWVDCQKTLFTAALCAKESPVCGSCVIKRKLEEKRNAEARPHHR